MARKYTESCRREEEEESRRKLGKEMQLVVLGGVIEARQDCFFEARQPHQNIAKLTRLKYVRVM